MRTEESSIPAKPILSEKKALGAQNPALPFYAVPLFILFIINRVSGKATNVIVCVFDVFSEAFFCSLLSVPFCDWKNRKKTIVLIFLLLYRAYLYLAILLCDQIIENM
jgi:hypothetical protein